MHGTIPFSLFVSVSAKWLKNKERLEIAIEKSISVMKNALTRVRDRTYLVLHGKLTRGGAEALGGSITAEC